MESTLLKLDLFEFNVTKLVDVDGAAPICSSHLWDNTNLIKSICPKANESNVCTDYKFDCMTEIVKNNNNKKSK